MGTNIESDTVVRAVLPTVLGSQEFYELRATDLLLRVPLETAIVVPGPIDVVRLKDALASALSFFPLYAGRLEKYGDVWRIRLSNDGALFDACVSTSPTPPVSPDAPVVQAPFTLARHIDHASLCSGSSDSPLLRVTLTLGPDGRWSVVGFSAAHIAGDGWIVAAFMRALSRLYQGLQLEPDQRVCYDYLFPLAASHSDEAIPTPWLDACSHPQAANLQTRPQTVRVDIRLSASQLSTLRHRVKALRPAEAHVLPLSKQDCLISALGLALSRSLQAYDALPISRITMTFNYRGVGSIPPTLSGNAIVQAVADIPLPSDAESSTASLSHAYVLSSVVRRALQLCRDPQHTLANVAICSKKLSSAANTTPPMLLDFSPRPGVLNVNSSRPFAWTSAHFGFVGRARFFHTTSDAPRYVKIFTPNPTPLPDGSWRCNDGAAEVVLYIEPYLRGTFVTEFVTILNAFGVEDEVDFVSL